MRYPAQENRLAAWIAIGVAVLTFVIFAPCLLAKFAGLDDTNLIVNNANFRGFGWENLRWMFTGSLNIGVYIPLSWMSLALDYLLWGMKPFGYHLTNLLLHAINASLFYLLIYKLNGGRRWAAVFAALFFSLHPLRVESVAWVVERRDVLSGLFFFLTILSYLRFVGAKDDQDKRRWYSFALAVYVLLLFAKAIGMTLPILLLLLDTYPLRRPMRNRQVWVEKFPFIVLGVLFALVAGFSQKVAGAVWLLQDLGIAERLALMFHSLFYYLFRTLWPVHLYPLHELPAHIQWSNPVYWGSVVSVIAMSGLALARRRSWPLLSIAWWIYVVTLLPVSRLAQSGPLEVADHASYLACLGWAALFGFLVDQRRRLGAALLACLGILTWQQCRVWYDAQTLYRFTIRVDPQSTIAREEQGNLLIAEGKQTEGVELLEQAFRIRPNVSLAYNLAVALDHEGRWPEAVQLYLFVLQAEKGHALAANNLGVLYRKMGRRKEAMAVLRAGLATREAPEFHYNIALLELDEGEWEKALAEYRTITEKWPDQISAYNQIAALSLSHGRYREAEDALRQVVRLDPNEASAHNNLGAVLANQGKQQEAAAEWTRALALDPKYERARENLRKISLH